MEGMDYGDFRRPAREVTDVDLPEGEAFLAARIDGHDVVYSVILRKSEHPFNREGVERHFEYECPPISI